jgi:hypothetical protein
MRVLWPEREHIELGKLLGRGAAADAAYVRAMLRFWAASAATRTAAEREVLAPARRNCGLSVNDAEETLDRLMLEPRVSRASRWEEALTFVTYLRRLTRGVTTLAVEGGGSSQAVERMEAVAERLDRVGSALLGGAEVQPVDDPANAMTGDSGSMAEQQMRRMERQVAVLERAAAELIVRPAA